jgi:S-adenosylmethionine:diacylglycerol 3-amino-3-carboxypropyl transferase
MHEDVEIERAAFRGKDRVFCIASAGDTAMELAAEHDVVACDINPVQLAYAQRRANGAPAMIGDAERAMNFARGFMPLIGWRREAVRAFLTLSDIREQMAFWREHLDTARFRVGLDCLMSRTILHALYAPQFLSFLPEKFGSVIRKRLERGFANHPNASNPYARGLLLGEVGEKSPPVTRNPQFVIGDAAAFLESSPARSFDGFALSNILDGTELSYRSRVAQAVRRAATDDAVVVLRSFAEPPAGLDTNHAERDRAMLWGVVDIRPAQSF